VGRFEVLLRVAPDLRRSASTSGNLVPKLSKPEGALRLIDRRRELLGGEEALRLQGTILPIFPFCDVEDDGVRVDWGG
jgi:hypothetical protein